MKYIDEFRDGNLISAAVREVERLADPARHYTIMEVCGGHTHSIYRYGLQDLLPDNVELIHGPGCPVCVLPMGRIDDGLRLAQENDAIFAAFGDVMRVPGSAGSPLERKSRGLDVRIVYSPLDALKLARENPGREVIYFAIGFETTAPSTALTLRAAKNGGVTNFSVFSNHVTIAPPIRAILDSPGMRLHALIGPGHVSTVIGCAPYEFIPRDYGLPVVVSGFEPVDLMQSIVMILEQLNEGRAEVVNQYARAVSPDGNRAALEAMAEVFTARQTFEWRGLGFIPESALGISAAYAAWDAEIKFDLQGVSVAEPESAQCGEVLKGALKPHQCRLFGRECTPERPIGALMVSSEGACAAHYQFARRVAEAGTVADAPAR